MKKHNALKILALLLLVSIPFGTKKFLSAPAGTVDEITSLFLYGTDILLLFFAACSIWALGLRKIFRIFRWTLPLVFLAFLPAFSAPLPATAFVQVSRLAFILFAASSLILAFKDEILSLPAALAALGTSAAFQALLSVFQFRYNRSLGLQLLGESPISLFTENVGRVWIGDGLFLRAYGTLPHANILAGFLAAGFVSLLALFVWRFRNPPSPRKSLIHLGILSGGVFLIGTGIALSFSRSGWITVLISSCLLLFLLFIKREWKTFGRLFTLLFLTGVFILASLGWAVVPRASLSRTEPSVNLRILYNEIGLSTLQKKPWGAGMGNQVAISESLGLYEQKGIKRLSNHQPVHNLYLLSASEIGVLGSAYLVLLLLIPSYKALQRKKYELLALFSVPLIFGLFDHFLWTLQSGKLMLWVLWGILASCAYFRDTGTEKPLSFNG